jgi:cytochrome c oxidase subunit IV
MNEQERMVDEQYHGHPSYVTIWVILLGLFGLSLIVGELGNAALSVFIVFVVAIIKAIYVLARFMHLEWEPKFFVGIALLSLLFVAFFFFGVYPDIVPIELIIAK